MLYPQKYENDVRQVNRVNANLRNKVVDFQGEKSAADARITQLENELADLRATHAVASSAEGVSPPDQNIINSAVRAAVAAKEAEISQALEKEAELNKALEQARAAVKAEPTDSTPSTTVADTRVAELERERNELKGQVEELQQKVKTLERQARNTEISRKTLERQKAETEARLKKLADGEPAAPLSRAIPESAPTLSSVVLESAATPITTPATEPRPPSAPGASSSTEVPPGSPMTTATTPTRGTVRGRARGVVKGTRAGVAGNRPNPILSGKLLLPHESFYHKLRSCFHHQRLTPLSPNHLPDHYRPQGRNGLYRKKTRPLSPGKLALRKARLAREYRVRLRGVERQREDGC